MQTRAERDYHNTIEQAKWPEESQRPATLEETWFAIDSDNPELMWLQKGIDTINTEIDREIEIRGSDEYKRVSIFQNRAGSDTLFIARYEMMKYNEKSQYPDVIGDYKEAKGWIDLFGGFPMDCIEIMVFVGLQSSIKNDVYIPDSGKKSAPKPDKFFYWPEEGRVLVTKTAKRESEAQWLIKGIDPAKLIAAGGKDPKNSLPDEPIPTRAHWWLRAIYIGGGKDNNDEELPEVMVPGVIPTPPGADQPKGIVPGEFVGLATRLMPDVPWGKQKSSPFFYSGVYIDTVYYTGARITEVIDPTDTVPYPMYKIAWRPTDKYEDGIVTAKPSDFAEYKVSDRVTILKDVTTEKKSQLWKDDDTKEFGETWMIAPISFYGLDKEK